MPLPASFPSYISSCTRPLLCCFNAMPPRFSLALLLGLSLGLRAEDAPPAGHAAHAVAEGAKTAEPKEDMFIALDPSAPKTVKLVIIAAYNAANYGMNFNGFAKGGAQYVIPQGWQVVVNFTNNSPVPHSAIVVERSFVRKIQMGEPAFKGASTPTPLRGTTGKKGVEFRFTAEEAGDYALACGFPAHSANGHWIGLEVSATAEKPSLKFGAGAPVLAK